jgi:transketolase
MFLAQSTAYQQAVLPPKITARVAVEAGVTDTWYRFVGHQGVVVGLSDYGQSAPAGVLFDHFNITVDAVIAAVNEVLAAEP